MMCCHCDEARVEFGGCDVALRDGALERRDLLILRLQLRVPVLEEREVVVEVRAQGFESRLGGLELCAHLILGVRRGRVRIDLLLSGRRALLLLRCVVALLLRRGFDIIRLLIVATQPRRRESPLEGCALLLLLRRGWRGPLTPGRARPRRYVRPGRIGPGLGRHGRHGGGRWGCRGCRRRLLLALLPHPAVGEPLRGREGNEEGAGKNGRNFLSARRSNEEET